MEGKRIGEGGWGKGFERMSGWKRELFAVVPGLHVTQIPKCISRSFEDAKRRSRGNTCAVHDVGS